MHKKLQKQVKIIVKTKMIKVKQKQYDKDKSFSNILTKRGK
jgi:hypothetical protein